MPNILSLFKKGNRTEEENERRRQEDHKKAREAQERRANISSWVNEQLWRVVKNRNDESKRFVCYKDLVQIWDYQRVIEPLAQGLDWSDSISTLQAKENFLRVMSTLVWIGWDRWDAFGSLFLHYQDDNRRRCRTDEQLPFDDTSFLHTDPVRISFKDQQFIFKPVLIIEDNPEQESDYVQYSEKDRLPFSYSEYIGRGGSGTVTKEEIPPGYFGFKQSSYNSKPWYVARKRFPGAGRQDRSFEVEQKSLRAFKKCTNQNGNIMQSYTAFLHGSEFNIIMPLADLDLHKYFEGKYDDFKFRSSYFSPAYLLYGAACLAGALRFLHEGLQVGIGEKMYCAHLDLKPENILVSWALAHETYPAGRWLVHDFGTSKIKQGREEPSSKTLVAPGDFIRQFSLTQASRTPGPFQAPEVQNTTERVVGTESDIWSLGCILSQVLTFALGGPSFVSQLAQSTYEGFEDDYFYNKKDKDFALKAPVVQYLDSLTFAHRDNTWIKETLGLIYRILVKDPRLRPSAKEVQDTLERVYRRQDDSLQLKCPWAQATDPQPQPPPPVPIACEEPPAHRPQRPPEPIHRHEGSIATPNQRPQRPISDRSQPRHRPSLPQVIVRSPTMANGDEQPGLEVVVSPAASSPRSDSMSQIELESIFGEHRTRRHSLSRSSSNSTRPVSLTEDVTFIRLFVPKNTIKSIICPTSCHAAFISKSQTSIMRIREYDWTQSPKCPIINAGYLQACSKDKPSSFDWKDGCMSGRYIVLTAMKTNGKDKNVFRYRCDDTGHTWNEEPIEDVDNLATNALDITVSEWGDVVFICNNELYYYSTKYRFLRLDTVGTHRSGCARFSSDGRWVFGWSQDAGINHFYKWDTHYHQRWSQTDNSVTLKRRWHIRDQPKSGERSGSGIPAIYPFSNYFVAFDRPDRVLIVGKQDSNPVVTKVQRDVRDVKGGTSVQGTLLEKEIESLVLLDHNSRLMTFPLTHHGAGNPSDGVKLKLNFNAETDAVALFQTGSDFYIVVSHCDGRLERRKVSTT